MKFFVVFKNMINIVLDNRFHLPAKPNKYVDVNTSLDNVGVHD